VREVLLRLGTVPAQHWWRRNQPVPEQGGEPWKRQYVAIDLHLNRSVVVRENEAGEKVGVTRIDNDPLALADALREAGEAPEVAIEATYGWYWAVNILEELGATVHLVTPRASTGRTGESRTTTGTAGICWTGCAWASYRRRGLPPLRCAS
jgi:hypothetical protein